MSELLLLSGGVDSAALAAWRRPAACLFIDYGQRPAEGERRAATAVCDALGIPLEGVQADCSSVGSGSLASVEVGQASGPTAEWWSFRNQLLVTLGASLAVRGGETTLLIGTVRDDGHRHADGRPEFVEALDRLLSQQEGGVRLSAPAIEMTTVELVQASGIADSVLAWTHSCHVSSWACGCCTGCQKRQGMLSDLGRL